MIRPVRVLATGVLGVLAIAIMALSVGLIAARAAGYTSLIVTGASMEPTIPVGSIVLVRPIPPEEVKVGDVVSMRSSTGLITHRVIGIERGPRGREFTLQGDANPVPDVERIAFAERAGLVVASVPRVGVAVAYARTYWRAVVGAAGAGLLLAGLLLILRRPRRQSVVTARRLLERTQVRARRLDHAAAA